MESVYLVAIEDRELPRALADVLVFPTGELDELVAPQPARIRR
jgi:hypothetical protein